MQIVGNLLDECPGQFNIMEVDSFCKENEIEILRLPPYHAELNTIEFFWAEFKKKIADRANTGEKFEKIKDLVKEVLSDIKLESIKHYCSNVKKVEGKFVDMLHLQLERRFERFIIPFDDDDVIVKIVIVMKKLSRLKMICIRYRRGGGWPNIKWRRGRNFERAKSIQREL